MGTQIVDLAPRQLQLLKRTIANDTNDEEFNLFIEAARHYRLDPFRRQILPLVFSKENPKKRRMSIIVGIDGQRILAQRCGNYRPASEQPEYEYDDAAKCPTNPLGIAVCRVKLWQQDNQGAWFPVAGEAYWDEFAPIKDEWAEDEQTGRRQPTGKKTLDTSGNWTRMPRLMIAKCATMQALRAGWPDEFGGVYTEEEMEKAKILDVDASEAVAKLAEDDRLLRIAHKDNIAITFGDRWGIEYVPLGSFFDRVSEWLHESGRTSDEVSAFRSANRIALNEYWAKSPTDALALKKRLEKAEATPAPDIEKAQAVAMAN